MLQGAQDGSLYGGRKKLNRLLNQVSAMTSQSDKLCCSVLHILKVEVMFCSVENSH